MKGIRSLWRRRLICLHEYSTVTSPCFSYKALRILRERLLKVSKHTSPVTVLRCNKTVFTVSVPELMTLNGWLSLSAEMKQISCSENPENLVTQLLSITEIRKVTVSGQTWWHLIQNSITIFKERKRQITKGARNAVKCTFSPFKR